jgi:hypothetical protein
VSSGVEVRSLNNVRLMNSRCEMGLQSFKVAVVLGLPRCKLIWKVVTWLILPVVICLSQRLSHACLSINKFVL